MLSNSFLGKRQTLLQAETKDHRPNPVPIFVFETLDKVHLFEGV